MQDILYFFKIVMYKSRFSGQMLYEDNNIFLGDNSSYMPFLGFCPLIIAIANLLPIKENMKSVKAISLIVSLKDR